MVYNSMIQDINISVDLRREQINELGRKGPYVTNVRFPVNFNTVLQLERSEEADLQLDNSDVPLLTPVRFIGPDDGVKMGVVVHGEWREDDYWYRVWDERRRKFYDVKRGRCQVIY